MRGLALALAAVLFGSQAYAQSGAAIYQRTLRKYPYAKPFVFGFATPSLAWFLPEAEWNRSTPKDRAKVVEYMPVLVARARANPDPYLNMPSSAPLYETAIAKVRAFSDDQWEIGVGQPAGSGNGRTLTMDTRVVCGASASDDCAGESAAAVLAKARQ